MNQFLLTMLETNDKNVEFLCKDILQRDSLCPKIELELPHSEIEICC